MTHTSTYETRNGKTYRVKNPAPSGAPGKPAAPKPNPGADIVAAPGKPAKEGV
jgi:hypothetical protein